MPRKSKTDQELGYLRAAWEEIEYASVESRWKVTIIVTPTISRGVWSVLLAAEHMDLFRGDLEPLRASHQFRFPNGRDQTFAGAIWEALHKFNISLEESNDAWKRAH